MTLVAMAYCESWDCKSGKKYRKKMIKKDNIPKGTVMCPDCGWALFWKLEEVSKPDKKKK